MNELATGELISHIGRSDHGRYFDGSYADLSGVKHLERVRVLDFMRPYFHNRVKLLSMPGKHWNFEEMLLAAHPNSQIVGIEKSLTVFLHARRAMPARGFDVSDRRLEYGNSFIEYARVTRKDKQRKKQVRSHRLLRMTLETYASLLMTDFGATVEQRNDFHARFCHRNAAWLDFTGSISGTMLSALRCLPLVMDVNQGPMPVVVTFFRGHDHCRGDDQRIEAVLAAQPLFKYQTHWRYIGHKSSPMMTICGTIT